MQICNLVFVSMCVRAYKLGRMFWGYSISASIALSHMFYLTVEHAEEFISTVHVSCPAVYT